VPLHVTELGANGHRDLHTPPALMTAAGLADLQSELELLRRRHREEIAEQLRDARSYGRGSNNDEYHALREEQMVVESRIAQLQATVAAATVIDPNTVADGAAAIGSTVVLEDLSSSNKARREYRLANAHSLDANGISAASPMGRALLGAIRGTVVTVDLPHGRSRSVRVIAVDDGEAGS
jgi:transcription elongation factor GreA